MNRSKTVSSGTSHTTVATTSHSHGVKQNKSQLSVAILGTLRTDLSEEVRNETTNSTTNGTSYSHSETWTADEYSITNECNNTEAKWTVDFKDPNDERYYFPQEDGSIQPASARRTDLNSE